MFFSLLRHSGLFPLCLGKSFVVFLVGLLPRSLFALLSFWWWDANLAGGSASCLVFLVVLICQAACDHLRPCNSFLTNSFFSCKDRALERDRPYQRKKKWHGCASGRRSAQLRAAVAGTQLGVPHCLTCVIFEPRGDRFVSIPRLVYNNNVAGTLLGACRAARGTTLSRKCHVWIARMISEYSMIKCIATM